MNCSPELYLETAILPLKKITLQWFRHLIKIMILISHLFLHRYMSYRKLK